MNWRQPQLQNAPRVSRVYKLVQTQDFTGLKDLLHAFYASIANDCYRNNELAGFEGYYASIFYSYFAAFAFSACQAWGEGLQGEYLQVAQIMIGLPFDGKNLIGVALWRLSPSAIYANAQASWFAVPRQASCLS